MIVHILLLRLHSCNIIVLVIEKLLIESIVSLWLLPIILLLRIYIHPIEKVSIILHRRLSRLLFKLGHLLLIEERLILLELFILEVHSIEVIVEWLLRSSLIVWVKWVNVLLLKVNLIQSSILIIWLRVSVVLIIHLV